MNAAQELVNLNSIPFPYGYVSLLLVPATQINVMMTNFQTWIVELFNAPQNFHNWWRDRGDRHKYAETVAKHMGILRMVCFIILDG